MIEKIEKKLNQDEVGFNCDICQDAPGGCQNCQGEYFSDNDPKKIQDELEMLEKNAREFEQKAKDDGLSFSCETCGRDDCNGRCTRRK